jgi:hypothetical protein
MQKSSKFRGKRQVTTPRELKQQRLDAWLRKQRRILDKQHRARRKSNDTA